MVKRILVGAFPDGGYGMRVSQAGYDVTSNPVDNTRLTFNSDWPSVLPLYQSGQFTFASGASSAGFSFVSLSYVPFALLFINIGSGMWVPVSATSPSFNGGAINFSYRITSTSLILTSPNALTTTFYFLYAILALPAF